MVYHLSSVMIKQMTDVQMTDVQMTDVQMTDVQMTDAQMTDARMDLLKKMKELFLLDCILP